MEALFSWIHLADLEFGEPTASALRAMLFEGLRRDVLEQARECPPDAIIVTGDVAHSGDAGQRAGEEGEYARAGRWLSALSASLGLGDEQVYVVPGNHDVSRAPGVWKRSIERLCARVREGDEGLDEALDDDEDRALLSLRFERYLDFAAGFAPACFDRPGARRLLWWSRALEGRHGLGLRLLGLNTAFVSAAGGDRSHLRLGVRQLGALPPRQEGEIVVIASHHPFMDRWLADEDSASRWIGSRAHLHLTGHGHELRALHIEMGAGRSIVRLTAGAQRAMGGGEGYRYNLAVVCLRDDGSLFLRVSPRRWSHKQAAFVVDVDEVAEGARQVEIALPVKLGAGGAAHGRARDEEGPWAWGRLLERRIEELSRACEPGELKGAADRVEKEVARYLAAVDDELKRLRADPAHAAGAEEIVRFEGRALVRRARKAVSRARLALVARGEALSEGEVFRSSEALFTFGVREDAAMLVAAAARAGLGFLATHGASLEDRTRDRDALDVALPGPPRGGGLDERLGEIWFRHHREELVRRYAGRFVATTADGVVALGASRREVEDALARLGMHGRRLVAYVAEAR